MSSILYIGKDYCYTLEQLQECFRHISSDEDTLYNELLTLQRDGLIAQWLDDGDAQEKELADKIRNLPIDLTNKEVMAKLAEILTNKNKNFNINLRSYMELKEVSYALIESSSDEVIFNKIENGEVLNLKDEDLNKTLRLMLKFKVLKPEKESFRLNAFLSLQQPKLEFILKDIPNLYVKKNIIHEVTTNLCLENEQVGQDIILYFDFPLPQSKEELDPYMIEVISESQKLFTLKLSLCISKIFSLNIYSVNDVYFKMIRVEGGTFEMGTHLGSERERPPHEVALDGFYIGETVVTQELWKTVMNDNPSFFKREDFPVSCVSFNNITDFLDKLNNLLKDQLYGKKFALPTEEQWEFAARGGNKSKGYRYSGSDDIYEVSWCKLNSNGIPHSVKKEGKKSNELGIYGMSGNVSEWCNSYWRANYNANLDKSYQVIRGGSFSESEFFSSVSYRTYCASHRRAANLGFRLILQ